MPELVVAPERVVAPDLRAQVLALQDAAWPPTGDAPAPGHDPELRPLSMLLVEGGRVVAALDILFKPLVHRSREYQAGGLSTVVTAPDVRRQGHGLRLVRLARARMADDGIDVGVFTCDVSLAPFYERGGFELLAGTQIIGGTRSDPLSSGPLGKVALAAFFTPLAVSHRAEFLGAEIELYPGSHDRLW